MQTLGIVAGLASAVLQSCSYVASAAFLRRHADARAMLMHSQAVQILFALPLLLALAPRGALADGALLAANALWLVIFTIAQFSMFAAQRTVEPSKIATWLGLKIVVLAVLTMLWPINGEAVTAAKWAAIALTVAAAWVLNASGGMRPGWRGGLALASLIVVSSLCDRQQVVIIGLFRARGASLFAASVLTLALGYATFGVAALAWVGWDAARSGVRTAGRRLRDSAPFAAFWFSAMVCIYYCYVTLGTVFGNVVQSSRAVIAVGVAFAAARWLRLGVETPVARAMWLRRLAAAALMSAGIGLYSLL